MKFSKNVLIKNVYDSAQKWSKSNRILITLVEHNKIRVGYLKKKHLKTFLLMS